MAYSENSDSQNHHPGTGSENTGNLRWNTLPKVPRT
jgi:hypothetical protein